MVWDHLPNLIQSKEAQLADIGASSKGDDSSKRSSQVSDDSSDEVCTVLQFSDRVQKLAKDVADDVRAATAARLEEFVAQSEQLFDDAILRLQGGRGDEELLPLPEDFRTRPASTATRRQRSRSFLSLEDRIEHCKLDEIEEAIAYALEKNEGFHNSAAITSLPEARESPSLFMPPRSSSRHLHVSFHSAAGPLKKSISTSDLRNAQNTVLAKMAVQPAIQEGGATPRQLHQAWRIFPWIALWFRIWGLFPAAPRSKASMRRTGSLTVTDRWLVLPRAHWNQLVMLLIAVAVIVHRVVVLFSVRLEIHRLCDFCLALNALLCLTSARWLHHCDLFNQHEAVLLKYAETRGFEGVWRDNSRRHLLMVMVIWLCVVSSRVVLGGLEGWQGAVASYSAQRATSYVDMAEFAFTSGIFAAVTVLLIHYMNALIAAIDQFSVLFMVNADVGKATHDWNVLQAMLRRASGAMEGCFMVAGTASMLMLLLCVADIFLGSSDADHAPSTVIPTLIPVLLLTAGMVNALFRAAAVTGRCVRVPPFINSLSFESGNDVDNDEMQRLVQYIDNSHAGFYLREVQVNAAIALKVLYISAVALFTMFTKAVTNN